VQRPDEDLPGIVAHHDLLRSYAELADDLLTQVRLLDEETAGLPGGRHVPETAEGLARLTDAFLLSAGMDQILEDYRHRDVMSLAKAGPRLADMAPAGRAAIEGVVGSVSAGAVMAARLLPRGRSAASTEKALARLVSVLAKRLAAAELYAIGREERTSNVSQAGQKDQSSGRAQMDELDRLGHLAQAVMPDLGAGGGSYSSRILLPPNCFRSFDQRPVDCFRLADVFAERWRDRSRPVLVVGLRTSGSYLAPLCSAFLDALGYSSSWVTLRPGQPLDPALATVLRGEAGRGALVALVDDPPRTGKAMAQAARSLAAWGFGRDSVVLLLPLLGDLGDVPGELAELPAAPLDWSEWEVSRQLGPASLTSLVASVVEGRLLYSEEVPVGGVESVELSYPARAERGHVEVEAVARVKRETGGARSVRLAIEGVGLGYLGRDVLVAAHRLADRVVPVHGVGNGFLVRSLAGHHGDEAGLCRLVRRDPVVAATRVAGYVAARAERASTASDPSMQMGGRGAVWESAAAMLGDAFGRAGPLARPLLRPAARRLLSVASPAVIDGDVGPDRWSLHGDVLLKSHFAELPSGNLDIYCSDPVFDLAGAAVELEAREAGEGGEATSGCCHRFETALLEQYRSAASKSAVPVEEPSSERWLLYKAFHADRQASLASHRLRRAVERSRSEPSTEGPDLAEMLTMLAMERVISRGVRRYLMSVLGGEDTERTGPTNATGPTNPTGPTNAAAPAEGPLCGVDVDGVLETRWLGAPCPSPAGARALRILALHGYRAVLASGRPAGELRDRCDDYRIDLAVAEYGAVVLDRRHGRETVVLTPGERADLSAAASALESVPFVVLDPASICCVRARRADGRGRPTGLDRDVVDETMAKAGVVGRLRVVETPTQTDLVPVALDKGRGLRALAEDLGVLVGQVAPFAMAVGDSPDDVPMFNLAARPIAPCDASEAVDAAARRSRHPSQEALLEAAQELAGHPGRSCPVCLVTPPRRPGALLVLGALSALGGRKKEKVAAAMTLAARLAVGAGR
jgi:hydroxymethylpyrimidine pyrophosphatase-like HAD family hydrolase